ncbi:MFS general substrate transporter [Hypoxylon trugodes]|uniref:MFS general substrate transporter n=1 Tax=Hypoxylon trugodes TaxID=326681 RepID=UPI00218DF784|nr:MFS general substrate transporter [Hypoxylon trugodes]KAI1392694.1 MFS general substrate transporter [Hypoxylon trugodes]
MVGYTRARRNSNEISEASTLLEGEERSDRPQRPSHRPHISLGSIPSVHVPKIHNGRTIINLLTLIAFVASCSSGFIGTPVTRVLEDIVCRKYYGLQQDGPIDEKECKGTEVQERVAFIMAIAGSLDAAVGFLAALPWGFAADRIGRKPVFIICLFGTVLNILWGVTVLYFNNVLPVELIWLGSAGYLIGGGNAILIGIILSIITDSTTEEKRGVAFVRLHVASMCGVLLSPSISSFVMEKLGPWPPIWAAMAALVTSAILFLFVPETLKHQPEGEAARAPEVQTEPQAKNLKSQISQSFTRFKESLSMLKSPSLILLLLTCLGSMPVLIATLGFMAQFISKRYDIRLAQTGYIQTGYGAVTVVQAIALLPWVSRYIMKGTAPKLLRVKDEHHRDLYLARWSYGFLAVGILILAISPSLPGFIVGLVVMALGSSFSSLTKSLMSLYVDPEHRSRLFSIVGMADVIGSLYAQPGLAGLFTLGMQLGGGWIGLPYYGLAIVVALAGSLLLFVKVPKQVKDSSSTREDGDDSD